MSPRLIPGLLLAVAVCCFALPGSAARAQDKKEKDEGPPPQYVDPFVAKLIDLLKNTNVTWEKGANACVALGKLGSQARPAVPAMGEFVTRGLNHIPTLRAYNDINLFDETLARALKGVGEVGADAEPLVPVVVKSLQIHIGIEINGQKIRFTQTNRAAARALGSIGSLTALPALCKAVTEDKEEEVRLDAVASIGRLGGQASPGEVMTQLRVVAETDESPTVRKAAQNLLGELRARIDVKKEDFKKVDFEKKEYKKEDFKKEEPKKEEKK